ncbi:MAG TPA: hypothetical protein PLZ55_08425, partial [bacterium]|nr:hypothetical protein [bacterium]
SDLPPLPPGEGWGEGTITTPLPSLLSNPQSAIPNPQSAIRNPQSAIPNPQSPIRNPQSAIGRGLG